MDLAAEREAREPHLSGSACCIACAHSWVAVAPVGTTWLECPSCGTHKGLFTGACCPPDGGEIWTCNCGSEVFYITPRAVHCYNCGVHQHALSVRAG
jgi:hypothetical protein